MRQAFVLEVHRERFCEMLEAIGWSADEAAEAAAYCVEEATHSEHPDAERHCQDAVLEQAGSGKTFAMWVEDEARH